MIAFMMKVWRKLENLLPWSGDIWYDVWAIEGKFRALKNFVSKAFSTSWDGLNMDKGNTTTFRSKEDVAKKWFLLDAQGKTLGRFAAEIAKILRGKHRARLYPVFGLW